MTVVSEGETKKSMCLTYLLWNDNDDDEDVYNTVTTENYHIYSVSYWFLLISSMK